MVHPVQTRSGHRFECSAIVKCLERTGVCPLTHEPTDAIELVPDHQLERQIRSWMKSRGISYEGDAPECCSSEEDDMSDEELALFLLISTDTVDEYDRLPKKRSSSRNTLCRQECLVV